MICYLYLVRPLSVFWMCSSFNSARTKRTTELGQWHVPLDVQSVYCWLHPSKHAFRSELVFMSWYILTRALNIRWPSESCHQSFISGIRVSILCAERVLSRPKLLNSESEFYYMVLHTWINIRVLDCSFIHCYSKNLWDIVLKSNLVQHRVSQRIQLQQ